MITKTQPSELCFLQFTSGSTCDAKGVMITHGGLIHNVKMMKKRYRSTSKTILISWLPQYHDMGLIEGLFTTLVSGGTSILFSIHWIQIRRKKQANLCLPNIDVVVKLASKPRGKGDSCELRNQFVKLAYFSPLLIFSPFFNHERTWATRAVGLDMAQNLLLSFLKLWPNQK